MSWFKRKNQPEIPPVAEPPASNNSYQSSTNSSFRSNASTYVASRDGDLSDPRAWGKDPNAYRPQQPYGQPQGGYQSNNGYGGGYDNRPNYTSRDSGYGGSGSGSGSGGEPKGYGGGYGDQTRPNKLRKDSGYGGEEKGYGGSMQNQGGAYGSGGAWTGPRESPFNRNREAFDPYSRGERNLDADRNALFSGAAQGQGAPVSNRFGGPGNYGENRPPPNPGEETEEDVEALKTDIRDIKNDTKSSTSRALEIARQAEQTGMSTLLKLGTQSGASTLRYRCTLGAHIDL